MQVKVAIPEESGRIMAHENLYFSNGNYDRRSSKLADNENAEFRVVFQRATVIYGRVPFDQKFRNEISVIPWDE